MEGRYGANLVCYKLEALNCDLCAPPGRLAGNDHIRGRQARWLARGGDQAQRAWFSGSQIEKSPS
tara:strand:- start:932 stop:1126 length:195 start_codon:yes stop_codon:yes gene_type:complete